MWKLIFLRGCVQSNSRHLLKRRTLPLPLPSGVTYRHLLSTHTLHFLLPITSITSFRPYFLVLSLDVIHSVLVSFLRDLFILFCVYGCLAYVYACASYMYSAHGGQKRASDSLELESAMVVSCHVSTEN